MAVLLSACSNVQPQRPSQRKRAAAEVDTAQLVLLEMNRQLAEAADEQIQRMAREQSESYALYEHGVWAYVEDRGEADQPIQAGDELTLHMTVFSLAGKRYTDSELTVRAGKYELPAAIDDNITEWHHGAQVRLFAPWYAAYGMKGTEYIPPYENIIIELKIR